MDAAAELGRNPVSKHHSRLTRDGTAEPVSRDQILRHARGQGNIHFPCSADHKQDWQPYPVDPYSAICNDHTYTHTLFSPNEQCGGWGGGVCCQTFSFVLFSLFSRPRAGLATV